MTDGGSSIGGGSSDLQSLEMDDGSLSASKKAVEKHSFIMNRRRGTAGPLNPK